jgi:integrase
MPAADPIRSKSHLRQLSSYFLQRGQFRNYALLILGVHTALRISDLLLLSWEQVYDERSGDFRSHITVTEKKTGKTKTIALNSKAAAALRLLFPHKRSEFIFANNRKDAAPISRIQAWRILHDAAVALGIGRVSPHSLRKSMGYHAWQDGTSPVVIMDIYSHSNYETTRRYLGVSQDDLDRAYLNLALF